METTMLDKIKLLLHLSDTREDSLLNLLISICKEEAFIYCNLDEYASYLDHCVMSMVVERYNRLGSESASSETVSGVSTDYYSFYSDNVVKMLNKHRRLKTL